ncbi:MAG: GNAT family N-acetyltransferase [Bacteroidales bacterium]|nr:GNAT family N-acetyltransferase [Candidatus Latescibacterota bacterium]
MSISCQIGSEIRIEGEQFYKSVGYSGGINDSDIVIISHQDTNVVGMTRLCEEEGVFVLRGLYVAEALRGTGIGTKLLQAASKSIGKRECWGVPFRNLLKFYSSAGFMECRESGAPEFLVERINKYISEGMDVVLVKRPFGNSDERGSV